MHSYLIDVLLPSNLYLLLQIALRKHLSVAASRIIGAVIPFPFGVVVEFLQQNNIPFLGSTYDPLDIFIYGLGIVLGILIDLTIIDRFESEKNW